MQLLTVTYLVHYSCLYLSPYCLFAFQSNGTQRVIEDGNYTIKFHNIFPYLRETDLRISWWRHQMETFSALLVICAGNSPVTVEFPTQRPVARSFDVFFDLRLNKRLSKQSWGCWFETLLRPLWRHCNVLDAWVVNDIFFYKRSNARPIETMIPEAFGI